jgi:hypothetical protein
LDWNLKLLRCSGYLVLALGSGTILAALWVMRAGFTPTPYGDYWTELYSFTLNAGSRFWPWIWAQHNEHRIPLQRLAMCLDLRWFGAHGVLLLVLVFLTLLLHWLLWVVFFKKTSALPDFVLMPITGFFAFCLFSPSQHENLVWAFQWSFVNAFFMASASFIALVWLSARERPWLAVSLASACALLAELSMVCGPLCWPVLWLGSLATPLRLRHRAVLFGVGLVCLLVYFRGYQPGAAHATPFQALRTPGSLLLYCATYLDHCLSHYVALTGFALLILTAAAVWALCVLLRRPNTRSAGLALALTMTFIVLTGFMTASGRVHLGMNQARASRYQTPALIYWACAFAAISIAIGQTQPQRRVLIWNLVAIVLIVWPAPELRPLIDDVEGRASDISLAGKSLDLGIRDPSVLAALIDPPANLIATSTYLQARGLHLEPIDRRPDTRPLASPSVACMGFLEEAAPVGPAVVRASGWALRTADECPVDYVAILDEQGRVLATSTLRFLRPDVLRAVPNSSGLPGWKVYVPLLPGSKGLHAVAITRGSTCLLK